MRQHTNTHSRRAILVSMLLAIILPASLIAGGLATADTADGESATGASTPALPESTDQEGRHTPGTDRQNPGATPAMPTPTLPAGPKSPLPSPSPLNTAFPLTSAQATPKKPSDTGIKSKTTDSQPQTRAAYTVTFNDPDGKTNTPSQSVPSGGQASRPKDPSRDGYLFNGWFTGNTAVAYDFSQPVTGSITLTAKWTRITSSWSLKPTSGPAEGGTRITLTTPTTSDIRFSHIETGKDFALAMGSDGNLYSWGNTTNGALGRETNQTPENLPGVVTPPTGVRFTQFSAGSGYSLALGSDGNLYSWGNNGTGQLGIGGADSNQHNTPSKGSMPADGTKFTQISAGYYHSLAMGTDGNLYSWGDNSLGQLGRALTSTSTLNDGTPHKVNPPAGVTRFIQVIAGGDNSLAMGWDGNLYSWGDNSKGQLGRSASSTQDGTPRRVAMPAGITITQGRIEGGYLGGYALGLGSDGNLYSWGDNSSRQLARTPASATPANRPGMVAFPESPRPTGISFGGTAGTNLAANTNGTWSVTTPQHAGGKTDVTVSWSRNGQQPDARLDYTYINPHTVTFDSAGGNPVPDPQRITIGKQATRPTSSPAKAGFLFDGWFLKDANGKSDVAYDFSQPVTGDITLVAHWSPANTGGWSINPSKGNAMGGQQATITPPKLSRGIRFNQVSAGILTNNFSIGVASDGNAYAWGSNQYGQLGQGTTSSTPQKTPVKVPLPDGVASGFTYTQAAAGGHHVLAIGSDGIVYSWGTNDHGQLGNGSLDANTPQTSPMPVKGADGQPFKAVQVSAGYADSAAISPDGRVYTWGSEYNEQGAWSTSKRAPTLAKDPDGSGQGLYAVQVSVGWGLVMALDADGNVYTWGFNNYGQLGNGTATGDNSTTYAADPARVPDPKDTSKAFKAVQISAGCFHALAIGQDGAAWTWGYNKFGQLGDGSTTNRPRPKQIGNPTDSSQPFQVAQINAGTIHSLAIDQNGTAWAWGWNVYGQLGDGTTSNRSTPTRVLPPAGQGSAGTGLATARTSGGYFHSLAIGRDGNAYAWGDNQYGELGNGSATQSSTPTPVAFNPALLITGVKFDQAAVGSLQQNADGSVSFATPVHNPGQADVIVDWTLGGTKQEPKHLSYTYEGTLPLTGGNGTMILLLAAGLLAAAGAVAAGHHRREAHALHV
ncbi:RCC1 domain-containing protein [Bifidobacterium polysaccharolyticum]|uniref:RCC1 domain-containing protein n=1 Tax=Bifidobacterium polysaccharolyticum TaxID=2750967 RepID=UPI0018DD4BCC|nr:InlB B-repeat-containing protein [Bifidobacterium polysaccharolyticum]MBI0063925.1 InlB B-repeat-containing protein [Bifidobacterium polysaccharolyticum]